MPSDIGIGIITMVMAILGGAVSAHAPTKVWQKVAYASAFVLLGVIGMYFIIRQSHETSASSVKLTNALEQLGRSTTEIQRSNIETTRIQTMNTLLQQRLLDSNASLSGLAKQGLNIATGGNGFCYLIFSATANGLMPMILYQGNYPLYGVKAQVIDLRTYDALIKETHGQPSVQTLGQILSIGDLMPNLAAMLLGTTIPFTDSVSQNFNIFFTARNGFWSELLRLRYVNGKWLHAIRVMRGSREQPLKERVIVEQINPSFPKDSLDWNK